MQASRVSDPPGPCLVTPARGSPCPLLSSAEELAQRLAEAIESGDQVLACQCAGKLAELAVSMSVRLKEQAYPQQEIR